MAPVRADASFGFGENGGVAGGAAVKEDQMDIDADVVIVGAGLAGLVAATEACAGGRNRVLILDQENEHNLGG